MFLTAQHDRLCHPAKDRSRNNSRQPYPRLDEYYTELLPGDCCSGQHLLLVFCGPILSFPGSLENRGASILTSGFGIFEAIPIAVADGQKGQSLPFDLG